MNVQDYVHTVKVMDWGNDVPDQNEGTVALVNIMIQAIKGCMVIKRSLQPD